jgi:hypothetical protein
MTIGLPSPPELALLPVDELQPVPNFEVTPKAVVAKSPRMI